MSKRVPRMYIHDILTSISDIDEFIHGLSFQDFQNDKKTIAAVVRNLEVIGEAANNIPKEFQATYSDMPWEKMVSMRNKILHEYFGVDLEIIWETITKDLPELKQQMKNLPDII